MQNPWLAGNNRPGFPGGNRPGIGGGNRPWIGSGNNIGSGNIGQIGDNLGIVSRPTNINNNNFFGGGGYSSGYNSAPTFINNNTSTNINTVTGGGGWGGGGGGGWGGGGWGGGWGGGGWGGGWGGNRGWSSPFYGNWYRGNWGGGNGFWTGFGAGALTSFGLTSAFGVTNTALGFGSFGIPATTFGIYDAFPTWTAGSYTDWGLGAVANDWMYSGYANPYASTVVAAQPAATTVVFDYSQPINLVTTAPEPEVATSTEQVFSAARDAFYQGDYTRAIELADQVIKQTPNVPVVHEFRALALFALQRYDEAAAVEYAVLTAGPGWNWSTLVGLYPDVDTYTSQLRNLEAYVTANTNSPAGRFLLADHYMVAGHNDEALSQFEQVVRLQPKDQLSASFVKALRKPSEPEPQVATATPGPGPVSEPTKPPASTPATTPAPSADTAEPAPTSPPPPPAAMAGSWKAHPTPDLTIDLTLKEDGAFTWEVDNKGEKQTLEGHAEFKDSTLALLHDNGPPLVGKVKQADPNKFVFAPPGAGDKAPGLTFTR